MQCATGDPILETKQARNSLLFILSCLLDSDYLPRSFLVLSFSSHFRHLNAVYDDGTMSVLLKHVDAPFHAFLVKLLENCHELISDHGSDYLTIQDLPLVGSQDLNSLAVSKKEFTNKDRCASQTLSIFLFYFSCSIRFAIFLSSISQFLSL